MKAYLERLNYSSSNEDSRSEMKALKINRSDTVLCITGSGARSLDLLIQKPKTLVSIDFNPCQNFLLELKMRAMEDLEYEEFLQFLGVRPSERRREIYRALRNRLSGKAKDFWDRHLRMVENGVVYQGGWERYFRRLAFIMSIVRPKILHQLFSSQTIEEQAKLWHRVWNSREWRAFLHLVSQRIVWKLLFQDPGFYRYVQASFSICSYFDLKFNQAFENILIHTSAYANLLFFGRYERSEALPPHLQKENFSTIKRNLSSIKIVNRSLGDYLENSHQNEFDKYSLSDFSSYTDKKEYERIWRGVLQTASPGARICERQFLVKRELPGPVKPYVRRDIFLEQELERMDDSLFFSFIIGDIKKMERRTHD
jgi:S-adenosylmethionine-diacylglycerol 3-amino-3-carboxypropyl transferase